MEPPDCPHCGADGAECVERSGAWWTCLVCAQKFPAFSENDKRLLKALRIAADA